LLDRKTYFNSQEDYLNALRERSDYLQEIIDKIDAGEKLSKSHEKEIESIRIKLEKTGIIDNNGI